MFDIVYDETHHANIHRCCARIVDILYISRLSRKLRKYIEHCSLCQITQIKRYRLYDELMSIKSSSKLFYTLVMNFIVVLFDELDIILSVICKFSRRIILISDKDVVVQLCSTIRADLPALAACLTWQPKTRNV